MDGTVSTDRGEVETAVKQGIVAVAVEYGLNEVDWQEEDKDVKKVLEEVLAMEFESPYAESYKEKLKPSYVMYGRKGVRTQLGYIASNCEDEEKEEKIEELREKLRR